MTKRIFRGLIISALTLLFPLLLHAQTAQPSDPPDGFEKTEQMVPMRDGVK